MKHGPSPRHGAELSARFTMNSLGVCYVADAAFLLPTLLSVTSLRRFLAPEAARVFVVVFRDDAIDLGSVKRATRHLAIEFIEVLPESLPSLSGFDWAATHVSPAAFGRFLLADLLPPEIGRILYLDGDTRIVGSLDPLLATPIPDGALAAADDAADLYRRDRSANGRTTRTYFEGIALNRDRSYFNSGVLLVGRRTWAEMAPKALGYLVNHPDRCVFHDQSALNATVGSSRVRLSPVWNFQSRFRSWGVSAGLAPRILHFTGAAKPWLGALAPWQDQFDPIAADAATFLPLSLPQRRMTPDEIAAHNAQSSGFKEQVRRLIDLRRRRRARAFLALARHGTV